MPDPVADAVPLRTIGLNWTRIGVIGFGGPPTHIALLRRLVVDERHWIDQREFEDALAACNLLPGPASTQLAIFLARRVGGPRGAIVGGLGFIVPAVVLILLLSVVFLAESPPVWVLGAGRGRRRRRCCGGGPRRREPGRAEPRPCRAAGALVRVRRARRHGRCLDRAAIWCWCCSAAGCSSSGSRVASATGRTSRVDAAIGARRSCGSRERRRAWRGRVGRVQGRSAVVRRRLRDHPADAGRRRAHISLDDLGPVPRRSRARPGHARSGRRHRRRGRLRRPRRRRRRARGRWSRSCPRSRSCCSAAATSSSCASSRGRRRSSTAPARRRSARSSALRSRSRRRSTRAGSSWCWAPPRWCCCSLRRGIVVDARRRGVVGAMLALAGAPVPR